MSEENLDNLREEDAAADLLEAAFFGLSLDEGVDQASVDLSHDLPLIEGYKLLRLLGEGGFGMVYEAEQRVPIRRRVALKVLRPGCTTRELLVRFEQERQALALMNHPHIAKIFDAGETEDGRPYIAMELVEGCTIDKRAKDLPVEAKVALMLEVCRAVAHAHHKGIIHRDLKPSNILITDGHQGKPEPRVIDFGIAKAMDGPLVTKVMFTQIRQVVGTPGYMSPERQHTSQISHSADTRTDVFALGAILWELLTGSTPVQSPDGGGTRVTLPNRPGVPAELRWITEKATDPDMEMRYANADGLADDLEAWLQGMPLKAAPRSTVYLISKWASRHRVAAGSVLASLLALIVMLLLLAQKNRQIQLALLDAEAAHQETLLRSANESYFMGVTRERKRPLTGLAHFAQALRQDPGHQAALGMALNTLRHRSLLTIAAPTVNIPDGKVLQVAVSPNGDWAAMILETAEGEVLVRSKRGGNRATAHPIPADGKMRHLAVSNAGHVAVAALFGAIGLLQSDGTWSASERDMEGLRFLGWSSTHELWWVSRSATSRCAADGKDVAEIVPIAGGSTESNTNADGSKLMVGLGGGRIMVLAADGSETKELQAPIPAPFSALAIRSDGAQIACAWRSGDVWVSTLDGMTSAYRATDAVLRLHFMPTTGAVLMLRPRALSLWDPQRGGPESTLELEEPLRTLLPIGPTSVLMQESFSRPLLKNLLGSSDTEDIPNMEGRVFCASTANGKIIALADEENKVLEWLSSPQNESQPSLSKVERHWLTLKSATDPAAWIGVDSGGAVCRVAIDGTAEVLWRTIEEPINRADSDATGANVLVDVSRAPSIFLCQKDQAPRPLPWGKPSTFALNSDGRLATLGFPSGEVQVYDLMRRKRLAARDWNRGAITAVTFVGDAQIAVGLASQARVWHWQEDTVLPTPIDLSGRLTTLAPCHEGRRLAAAGDDGSLHIIDIKTGRRTVGLLTGPEFCTALGWMPADTGLVAFGKAEAVSIPVAPLLNESPPWLPSWIEHHIGLKINQDGRAVRLHSRDAFPVPPEAHPHLRAWLQTQ